MSKKPKYIRKDREQAFKFLKRDLKYRYFKLSKPFTELMRNLATYTLGVYTILTQNVMAKHFLKHPSLFTMSLVLLAPMVVFSIFLWIEVDGYRKYKKRLGL